VINGLDQMLSRLIGDNVLLVLRLHDGPLIVKADPGQLEQVVLNLVTNAREAMPKGGTLTVATEADDEHAVLVVRDNGEGIAPEIAERIFEPFFTTKEQGSGLGLSTVFGIVKQSGGEVRQTTPATGGALFRVELPLKATAAGSTRAAAGRSKAAPGTQGGRETILLVEDDPSVASLMVRILHEQGYRVHRAHNGREALEAVQEKSLQFDLLLTDVVMPEMGGPELVLRLRESRPDLKVLFASGYTDDALVQAGIERGTIDLIAKPFTPSELSLRVRQALDAG
jgi:CheY-like chemotaxis protein